MLLADSFTDTNGTAIGSHTPEKGGAPTKHVSSTPVPTIQGNGLISSTSGAAWAHYPPSPATASVEVNGVILMGASATNEVGVCARMDTSATTFYGVRYEAAAGQFVLYKTVAGVETQLGSPFPFANVAGAKVYVTFNCDTVKQVFVNGDLAIESTDNAISGTAKVGIRVKGNDVVGAYLDRVWATDGYTGAIDSFNNSYDASPVTNRAGALRSRWVKGPGQTSNIHLWTPDTSGYGTAPSALPGGSAYDITTTTAYYVITAAPSSADYDVSAIILHRQTTLDSQVSLAGPTGRGTTAAAPDYYTARYNATIGTQAWELIRLKTNVTTILGTWPETNVIAALSHVTLEMIGSVISVWVDGIKRITVTDSAPLTVAGLPGYAVRAGTGTAQTDRVQVAEFHFSGAVTDATPPATPTLNSATAKVGAVTCVWTTVADVGSAGLKGYRVEYRLTGGSGPWTMSDFVFTGTTGTVYGLPTGTSYDFRVRAEDNFGNLSATSNAIAATPIAPTPQPAAYNAVTGTHSGSVTVGQVSLTGDPGQKSVDYAGGKTTFPDDAAFDVGSALTVRAIVKPDTVPSAGTRRTIIGRTGTYFLKMNGSSLEGIIYIGASPVTISAASVFVASTTADVAMTYDGATLKLWNLGVQVASQAQAGAVDATAADIVVGSLSGGTEAFDGKIQQPEVLAETLVVDRLLQDALAVL